MTATFKRTAETHHSLAIGLKIMISGVATDMLTITIKLQAAYPF
jgi:hypothetical protein